MEMVKKWMDFVMFKRTAQDILNEAEIGNALKQYIIAITIVSVLSAISVSILGFAAVDLAATAITIPGMGSMVQAGIGIGTVMIIVGNIVGGIVGLFIIGAILHLFSKIVGGKGDLMKYISALFLVSAAITGTIGIIIAILLIIGALLVLALGAIGLVLSGLIVMIVGLITLIAGLIALYRIIEITSIEQKISFARAIIAIIIIPIIISVILSIIIIALGLAAFLTIASATTTQII